MTTLKHHKFVSEPIGDKSVTELPGIGDVLGGRLSQAGYRKAKDVLDKYLSLNRDKESFKSWLCLVCFANARWSEDCWRGLHDWCKNFLPEYVKTQPLIKMMPVKKQETISQESIKPFYKLENISGTEEKLDGKESLDEVKPLQDAPPKPIEKLVEHDSFKVIAADKKILTPSLAPTFQFSEPTSKQDITFGSNIEGKKPELAEKPQNNLKSDKKSTSDDKSYSNLTQPNINPFNVSPLKSSSLNYPFRSDTKAGSDNKPQPKSNPTIMKGYINSMANNKSVSDENSIIIDGSSNTIKVKSNSNRTFVEYVFSRLEDMDPKEAKEMRKGLIRVLEELD